MNTEETTVQERTPKMQVGSYEVLCREDGSIFRLGQGPTSSSYKAVDVDLRTPVVLKVMRPELFEDETARKRFLREARAAALLRHPNVAQIYRLGEQDGMCFYAREFVTGETLEDRVNREGPLAVPVALKAALQVAEALVAVKEAQLVHRDIKPSNLMLTPRGDVKLIDFGLTKGNANSQVDGVGQITLTGFVGSSDYASPEQLGEEPLEVTSDMYSLGVTLWFLLTGRCPFRGSQARVMAAHLSTPPPFEELSSLPTPVVGLLAHLLEKDPTRRPATPAELVAEINACLGTLGQGAGAGHGATLSAPTSAPVPVASPAPVAKKVSPNREPAREGSPRRFVLVELLVGAGIAVIMYLILSRPVDLPTGNTAAADGQSETVTAVPAPAGARLTVSPDAPAEPNAAASSAPASKSTRRGAVPSGERRSQVAAERP